MIALIMVGVIGMFVLVLICEEFDSQRKHDIEKLKLEIEKLKLEQGNKNGN